MAKHMANKQRPTKTVGLEWGMFFADVSKHFNGECTVLLRISKTRPNVKLLSVKGIHNE